MSDTIVVTRHAALVQYLIEQGLVSASVSVITHATPDDVRDKHVIGVLPLSLAALAASVTEVPLILPAELRGHELTLEQVRAHARPVAMYHVAVV